MRAKLGLLGCVLLLACGGTDAETTPARPTATAETTTPETATAETTREEEEVAPEPAATSSSDDEADPLLTADDFLFEWARGSGALFVDQVSLRGDGQLIWVRTPQGETNARVLETRASEGEVRAVRAALASAGYFGLAPEHVEPGIADGSQLTLRVRAGGRRHRVHCDNRFPQEIASIRTAVEALFTDARVAALASAPEAQPEDFDPSLPVD